MQNQVHVLALWRAREHSRFSPTHDLPFGGTPLNRDSCFATVIAALPSSSVTVDEITHVGHEAIPLTSSDSSRLHLALDEYQPAQADKPLSLV